METNGRLQGPGYQVLLFHQLIQTAAEQWRMFLKKGTEVVFAPLVTLVPLSTLTAEDCV